MTPNISGTSNRVKTRLLPKRIAEVKKKPARLHKPAFNTRFLREIWLAMVMHPLRQIFGCRDACFLSHELALPGAPGELQLPLHENSGCING
jgi:hypothetical protein